MKQAVAPKKPLDELWDWVHSTINPNIIVLTEARVPKDGLPDGWQAVWTPGGIGPRRTWGTVIAVRNHDIRPTTFSRNAANDPTFIEPHPGSVHTADIIIDNQVWATVVGAYGFMPEAKNGWDSLAGIVHECADVFDSGVNRLILAGDFNLWPDDLVPTIEENLFLIDVVGNIEGIKPMPDGRGGSRIWTHKNGNSPNAAKQELDFIFISEALGNQLLGAGGGIEDFPDAWDYSDHAPVIAYFEF